MFKHNMFFHPEEVVDKGDGIESMIKFMDDAEEKDEKEVIDLKDPKNEKEVEKDDEEEVVEEEEKDEEKDELDELEEELEGPDEDKLELVTPVRRKEILTKYPKLFKDFPYLEKAYYREQQFTEVVATIQDAKDAVEAQKVLDLFGKDLGDGNIETALKTVKDSGEAAFNKLVDNYLPSLAKLDKDAYHHVVGNIIKTTVNSMINVGKQSNDEDLQAAAKILHNFIYPNSAITGPTNLARKEDENKVDTKLQEREQEYFQQRLNDSIETVSTKIDNVLKATIEGHIDPKESMTPYVRKTAVRECLEELDSVLSKDRRLINLTDRLWQEAGRVGFTKESLDKIKSARLSVAKTVLPTLLKKARNEALRGSGKRVKDDEDDTPKKGPVAAGKSASPERNSGGKSDREKAKAIPAGMSTRDYLNSD